MQPAESAAIGSSAAWALGQAGWTPDLVLERYELVYEAALVAESWHDRGATAPEGRILKGTSMALDHRRILATALGRMRGKLRYRPVVFELMPPEFTLFELQRVIEAISGRDLHKQNFRRLVANQRLVEATGVRKSDTGGRPGAPLPLPARSAGGTPRRRSTLEAGNDTRHALRTACSCIFTRPLS